MNIQDPKTLKPGEARCTAPSTREIILADVTETPAALTTEQYEFIGDEDIAYDRYTDQAFADAELDKMWTRVWQWTCREEHIPEVGDHVVYDIGDYSFIIVHTDAGYKAYYNSCLHRYAR